MTKKHKKTADFSPRAMRIYKIAQRGVAARSNQQSVLRAIDQEIDTIKVGSSDPELKVEIANLKGQLADEQQASEILATSNSQLTADVAEAKGAGTEAIKKLEDNLKLSHSETLQEATMLKKANDTIKELEAKIQELEAAGADKSAGSDSAEETTDPVDPAEETTDPDADPKE